MIVGASGKTPPAKGVILRARFCRGDGFSQSFRACGVFTLIFGACPTPADLPIIIIHP